MNKEMGKERKKKILKSVLCLFLGIWMKFQNDHIYIRASFKFWPNTKNISYSKLLR